MLALLPLVLLLLLAVFPPPPPRFSDNNREQKEEGFVVVVATAIIILLIFFFVVVVVVVVVVLVVVFHALARFLKRERVTQREKRKTSNCSITRDPTRERRIGERARRRKCSAYFKGKRNEPMQKQKPRR
jgi:flagellar biosynthesis/type III secretory pathway M-ring protein FliF/YscJ